MADMKEEPKNLEAEMCVLGCAYMSSSALEKVCDELSSDMFYDKRNSVIYDALSELKKRNEKIDSTILKNEIEKNTPINSVGGVEYLSDVIDSVVSASNIDSYIKIVREKALRRKLITVCEDIEKNARVEDQDTNDLIESAEKKLFTVTKARKAGEFRTSREVLKSAISQLETLSKNDSDVTGVPTGFYDFDKLTSGLHPNELIIIAARPAMGKTAFALNIAVNAALATNKAVAIFNLEMGAEQLMFRMLSAASSVEGNKLKTGKLSHDDWKKINEATSELGDAPIFIEDTPGITIGEIRAKCRRLASAGNLGLIVIDYLQLISGGPGYGNNRQQEVSDISRSLKTMAMELGVPVIALAQLSRNVEGRENKRPIMSDLRESGSIEQDADIVSFLYRDDYYTKQVDNPDGISISELIIGKHRNGATGTIELLFEKNISNFRNYVKNVEET
ncbi:primary replicative DNA helicase [Firmicutes bacterium CAG:582]|nr:primary replicative DNA helicase [Firmicutes bacterium CAG:582]